MHTSPASSSETSHAATGACTWDNQRTQTASSSVLAQTIGTPPVGTALGPKCTLVLLLRQRPLALLIGPVAILRVRGIGKLLERREGRRVGARDGLPVVVHEGG